MKSIFDKATIEELIHRINSLNENAKPLWGKMNAAQMLRHCTMWDEMALGKKTYKQGWLGKLVGKFALKDMMKDEPMKKNMPTVPSFKITDKVDFLKEQQKWIALLNEYQYLKINGFVHPFFGQLTKEQVGYMAYKHIDHHLKQFNN